MHDRHGDLSQIPSCYLAPKTCLKKNMFHGKCVAAWENKSEGGSRRLHSPNCPKLRFVFSCFFNNVNLWQKKRDTWLMNSVCNTFTVLLCCDIIIIIIIIIEKAYTLCTLDNRIKDISNEKFRMVWLKWFIPLPRLAWREMGRWKRWRVGSCLNALAVPDNLFPQLQKSKVNQVM